MIADLKPYPEYKESGLPWLGQVPEHWVTKRGKSYLTAIDQRSKTGREELLTVSSARGIVPRSSANVTMFKAESYAGHKLCWPGDLVINSLWAWAGGLGVSQHHGIISTAYSVYRSRPSAQINSRFLHELVRSAAFHWELQVRSKGVWISRLQLTDTAFLDAPIPLPPPAEQAAIVRFLDWANGRLERAIRAKRKVIAMLNEQKQAIIHRAVTRGLDPSTPLKPSGIPWLGIIPQHWELRRLKWVLRLQRGFDLPADRRIPGSVPVYSSGGHIDNHNVALATCPGVVIGRYGSTDAVFFVAEPYWPHNTALFTTSLYDNHARWCFYLLRSIAKGAYAGKSAVPGVDRKDLFDIVVPRPPVEEQRAIAEAIDQQLAAFDVSIQSIATEIDLLREYRARLITDLVTGKLDVRQAAERLPPEAEDLVISEATTSLDYDLEVAEELEPVGDEAKG